MTVIKLLGVASVTSFILLGCASKPAVIAADTTSEKKSSVIQKSDERSEIPTEEHAFVQAIGKLNKAKIIELLGEPAKAEDVKLKDSGRVVASIWHYHNINTNPEGVYYETTELDFIDDVVNVVVFLNNDGSDVNAGQKYEVPAQMPNL